MALSKNQLDKLGDRLRRGTPDPQDDDELAEYRLGHSASLEEVQAGIRQAVGLESSGRLKAPESIVAKLQRQTIKLSQIGDIAGCRLTVDDAPAQDRLLIAFRAVFPGHAEKDYRERPQNGYRAVHMLVRSSTSQRVEVQIRTRAQNAWANVSEVLAGRLDPAVKYGGGPERARELLTALSTWCHLLDWSLQTTEQVENLVQHLRKRDSVVSSGLDQAPHGDPISALEELLDQERERTATMGSGFHETCARIIEEARG